MTWLLDTLVWTGVLIALVLAVRQPVARHFGAKIAYALWALPLLRLVMPPLVLEAPTPSALPAAQSVEATPELIAALAAMEAANVPSAQAPAAWWESLTPLLVAVWLLGAATYIGLRLLAYRQLRRDLLDGAYTVGSAGNVRLVETYATRSPLAFGLFDKVIAMPVGFVLILVQIIMGVIGLLVAIYPTMKRITSWPQVVLGFAFNWGALVGYAAVTGTLSWATVALYIGGVAWTMVYDTIYAMQDREDDALVGIKSSALRLGGRIDASRAGIDPGDVVIVHDLRAAAGGFSMTDRGAA